MVSLRKSRPHESTISEEEFQALKALNNDHNVVFLKEDKGGATVILHKTM